MGGSFLPKREGEIGGERGREREREGGRGREREGEGERGTIPNITVELVIFVG